MDKLSSLTRFKASCPFLGRTKTSTLRNLTTTSSARFPSLSVLTERAATGCPVMGPALNVRSKEIVAGYASVAGNGDVASIHKQQGIFPPAGATIEMCPHASAARAAARMAEDLAAAAKKKDKHEAAKKAKETAAAADAGCPFHKNAAADASTAKPKPATPSGFDYESFYVNELDKKHKDSSYRYFNNINRLAAKFPVAHTSDVKDEVEVWCANDYLGMGNNPVVLETMQYVYSVQFPRPLC
jgi:5-aminolevulinate synthase